MKSEDGLVAAIEAVRAAGDAATAAIDDAVRSIELIRDDLETGAPMVEIVDRMLAVGTRTARLRAASAITDFEHSVMVLRSGIIRSLVDGYGMTLSDVARRLGISRQMTARLYHAGDDGADDEPVADAAG